MEITTPLGVRKGAWTREEDLLLREYIDKYGEGKWHQVPLGAGLNRCRKSCRLRWLNYLKPTIKRGDFALDEVDLIIRLHNLLGNRWSLIAGRLPGRTANDVKNYWNTQLRKKQVAHEGDDERAKSLKITTELSKIIKPRPRRFSGNLASLSGNTTNIIDNDIILRDSLTKPSPTSTLGIDENPWWDNMLVDNGVTWFMSVSNHEELVTIGSSSGEDVATGVEASDNSFVQEGKNGWNDISNDHVELWDLLE